MATKFNSDAESRKWKALEATASIPLQRLLAGTATPVDIRATTKLLQQQSKLAASVFEEGVRAVEMTADQVLDKMNSKRADQGKKPLTQKAHARLYKQTFEEVMKNYAPDIIGSLKDIITEQFDEGLKETNETITKGFDKLHGYRPTELQPTRDLPSTDDLIAIHQASAEDSIKHEDRKWPSRLADIKTAVESAVGTTIRSLVDKMTSDKEAKVGNSDDLDTGYSPTAKLASMRGEDNEVLDTVTDDKGQVFPLVQLQPQTEAAVVDATRTQTGFNATIENLLRDKKAADANADDGDESASDAKEERKASSWFRKFGDMFKHKKSKKGLFGGSPLSMILKGLALALTAPQLIDTVARAAKEYLSMDNIMKFLKTTLNTVYETGSSLVDWVLDKLGVNKKFEADPNNLGVNKRVDDRITDATTRLTAAQQAQTAAGGDISKLTEQQRTDLSELPKTLTELQKIRGMSGQKWGAQKASNGSPMASAAAGTLAGGGNGLATLDTNSTPATAGSSPTATANTLLTPSSVSAPTDLTKQASNASSNQDLNDYVMNTKTGKLEPIDSNGKSSVISNPKSGPQSTTIPQSAVMPTSMKPVVVNDPNATPAANATINRAAAPMQVSPAITMSSFGMHPSSDDTLHLLNLGAIS